ncbi:hypothetical protein [Pseudomonas sp. PNPG3]|uniref:hypothetical protein n=1 Tax=Pseudomonas sp. PNPG3 TaxID=2919497 RepID=UPI001FFD65BD|nr:hypothetical protein [Pseudomonas sp. PNPG3]MCK2122132.1 hypothetical protein [Pseudomonas sp. PNPG3]
MADFSVDGLGKTVAGAVKGVTGTIAGSTSNKVLGSAARTVGKVGEGVVTGTVAAGTDALDNIVGGTENRKAIENGVRTVAGTVHDLFTGKQTISGVVGQVEGKVESLLGGDGAEKTIGTVFGSVGSLAGLKQSNNDLGSDWGNLSPLLLARVFVCDSKGVADMQEFAGVYGAMTEGAVSIQQNWQSPFENTGPETKAPALAGMLQSGSLVPVLNALQAISPFKDGAISDALNASSDKLKTVMRDLEGRTGITKLNSRQVFSGMPPVKFTATIRFRAVANAQKEVMAPLARLSEWIFPQMLAEDGILSEVLQTTKDVDSFIKALFPSIAPKLLGLTYGGSTYAPVVIENLDYPLDGPKDGNGNFIDLPVQISFATLTALDRADIKRWFSRR